MTTFAGMLIIAGLTIACGAIMERWFSEAGLCPNRSNRIIGVLAGAIVFKEIVIPAFSWTFYAPIILTVAILLVNAKDFWTTRNKGRWWWE